MKTTIGGDRLGSGNKQKVSLKSYKRTTHDLSFLWRSSMSSGTLVPFMSNVALPGDSFDIDLALEALTLPTVGPLYGSFKIQADVFQIPIRLYNAALHMNKLGIGMDMSSVFLPRLTVRSDFSAGVTRPTDNSQINPSSILKYLGISGIGHITASDVDYAQRVFNAVPFLGYWDIYKNYYSNKQEERGFFIHTDETSIAARQAIIGAKLISGIDDDLGTILSTGKDPVTGEAETVVIQFGANAAQMQPSSINITVTGTGTVTLADYFTSFAWVEDDKQMIVGNASSAGNILLIPGGQTPAPVSPIEDSAPSLREFDLDNIDTMRELILQHSPTNVPFNIVGSGLDPYQGMEDRLNDDTYPMQYTQEGLGIKTYQSDLFNNWISTEWIDGVNGINEITAVDTTGDSFTIDSLNLANKVYNMLNRIALSGGSYDDWIDAVYTHERSRAIESPVYLGSLIKELAFESVISNSDTQIDGNTQPLGTLAGRGRLTSKNKGGKVKVRIDEPSYIMGIVSITPRLDYSQGNKWDVNLNTMNDFHKPALDAIGFQELITEQMVWSDTTVSMAAGVTTKVQRSAGKQPAWINYMTDVNRCYGNFAERTKEMFMTLNRRWDIGATGQIQDLTTYIDPTKFNQIFAQTNLDAQNFWVQISADITARRKMSAKVIPNL